MRRTSDASKLKEYFGSLKVKLMTMISEGGEEVLREHEKDVQEVCDGLDSVAGLLAGSAITTWDKDWSARVHSMFGLGGVRTHLGTHLLEVFVFSVLGGSALNVPVSGPVSQEWKLALEDARDAMLPEAKGPIDAKAIRAKMMALALTKGLSRL